MQKLQFIHKLMPWHISNHKKITKNGYITQRHIDIYAMCWWVVSPFHFLSRVSTLMHDIDIAILPVRPSVHDVPVLDENGLTYRHSFFTIPISPKSSFLASYTQNSSCIPNLKLLALMVVEINTGSEFFWLVP